MLIAIPIQKALLHELDKINDPIAFQLLPERSRWVLPVAAKLLPDSVLDKLDWIVQRTNFIDRQLDDFLSQTTATQKRRQVVVLGSGYDTRCLRYTAGGADVDFYVIDLPSVSKNCQKLIDRYLTTVDTSSDGNKPKSPTFIGFDLNDVVTKNKSLVKDGLLMSKSDGCNEFVADGTVPTMIICEAVLFYLIPAAAQKITTELFQLSSSSSSEFRYCFTDNLSKVGVVPGGGPGGPPEVVARTRCEGWLKDNDKELIDHDSIWGGAIHFVGAK